MSKFMHMLTLTAVVFSASLLLAEQRPNHSKRCVSAKGGGTMVNPNALSGGFSVANSQIDFKAKGNKIIRGIFTVSSEAAGPVDPVTGVAFEATTTLDAYRIFADHPTIIWFHGFANPGSFVKIGTGIGTGNTFTPIFFEQCGPNSGEFVGCIDSWGRSNFITILEGGDCETIRSFCSIPEEGTGTTPQSLINLVGGFSRIFVNGTEPDSKFIIKTTGKDETGGCPLATVCPPCPVQK